MSWLGRCLLTGVAVASALVAAASGPIDQQQTEHPFVDGGLTCFTGQTGGLAQGVIPKAGAQSVRPCGVQLLTGFLADSGARGLLRF